MGMLAEHWKSGVSWLGWNCLGMLGIWGTGSLLLFFLNDPPWFQLMDGGQLLLYSVGMLAQVIYILTKERKITEVPYRSLLIFLSFSCFLVCAVLFSGTVLTNFTDSPDLEPRIWLMRSLSMVTFVASITVGVMVTIAAEERQEVDIPRLIGANMSRLDDKVSGV